MLHVLALDQIRQDRLRVELQSTGVGQCPSWDDLSKLPYLDAVCKETLRVCGTLSRTSVCTSAHHLQVLASYATSQSVGLDFTPLAVRHVTDKVRIVLDKTSSFR